jgi:hypothetical protein
VTRPGSQLGRGAERHGKDGAEAVNDVGTEEQRNVQARIVDGGVLKVVGEVLPDGIQHGS